MPKYMTGYELKRTDKIKQIESCGKQNIEQDSLLVFLVNSSLDKDQLRVLTPENVNLYHLEKKFAFIDFFLVSKEDDDYAPALIKVVNLNDLIRKDNAIYVDLRGVKSSSRVGTRKLYERLTTGDDLPKHMALSSGELGIAPNKYFQNFFDF